MYIQLGVMLRIWLNIFADDGAEQSRQQGHWDDAAHCEASHVCLQGEAWIEKFDERIRVEGTTSTA